MKAISKTIRVDGRMENAYRFPRLPLFASSGISDLRKLESLSLCMNGLLRMPPGLETLDSLTRLDIRHNNLRLIPAGREPACMCL